MKRLFLLTIFLLHYGPVYVGWLAIEKQANLPVLKPSTSTPN